MLRLILMRHAEAEPARGRRDHVRPLSEAGIREARTAGQALAGADILPEAVLVSDSARTLGTLDCVSAAFHARTPNHVLPELYGASAGTILAAVRGLPDRISTALVIGHNPGIGELARSMARTGDAADLAALEAHFPTACRAVLLLDADRWAEAGTGRLAALLGARHG